MTVLNKSQLAVLAVMQDSVPRTVLEVSMAIHGRYKCNVGTAIRLLLAKKLLDRAGTANVGDCVRAPVYRLAPPVVVEPEAPTDNPFLWRTYKQYEAEVSKLHGY